MRKTKSLLKNRENRAGYIFLIPWIIGFCLFFLYPLCYSLVLAFSSITDQVNFELKFVFLDNFKEALTTDVNFLPALMQSLANLVDIPIVIIFSLFVATLLNKNIKGRGFFRVMFLLPIVIGAGAVMEAIQGNSSQVSVALGQMQGAGGAAADAGVSFQDLVLNNQLTTLLGPELSGIIGAVVNKISSVMWISGVQIVIFLGVLQTIPESLYEAAVVDGASEFDKLWKITLPLTMPAIQLNIVFTLISSFTSADNAVISYITDVSFGSFMLSYGSALSWIYFLIIGILLAITFKILKRYTFYMG